MECEQTCGLKHVQTVLFYSVEKQNLYRKKGIFTECLQCNKELYVCEQVYTFKPDHYPARTQQPLQCHSAQLCRERQAYACQTLQCGTFGCVTGCDWSIRNGAELNGSVYRVPVYWGKVPSWKVCTNPMGANAIYSSLSTKKTQKNKKKSSITGVYTLECV